MHSVLFELLIQEKLLFILFSGKVGNIDLEKKLIEISFLFSLVLFTNEFQNCRIRRKILIYTFLAFFSKSKGN